jgi:hypothetical protein
LIGFCFTGKEGYERIKFAVKGFLRKDMGGRKNE